LHCYCLAVFSHHVSFGETALSKELFFLQRDLCR
jgi:hypothetical protein